MQVKSIKTLTLGEKRGVPRLWIEGEQAQRAGFHPGLRFSLVTDDDGERVVLRIAEQGERTVSGKDKAGRRVPVIDINSAEALAILAGFGTVRVVFLPGEIHVLPDAIALRQRQRKARLEAEVAEGRLTVGSVSHGAGIMSHALHEGLGEAGIRSELAFAVDIDGEALDVAARNNPAWSGATVAVGLPLQTLAFADRWALSRLPVVSMLEAGLPCTAASVAGRSKKGLKQAEDDDKAGHLVAGFIALIAHLNPAIVLLENVRPYFQTASAAILRAQLRELGYAVAEHAIDGGDYAIEARPRTVLLATTQGVNIDLSALVAPPRAVTPLSAILENVPEDAPEWRAVEYLKAKEAADKAAGKGFAMQVVPASATRVGTIGTGYQKARSTEPRLAHPTKPGLSRLFTPVEHARIKGIPESLIDGVESLTEAHALLGQSVIWPAFRAIGRCIGKAISPALPLKASARAA